MTISRRIANAIGCAAQPIAALIDRFAPFADKDPPDNWPKLQLACLIAQCAHESGDFAYSRESMNYSPGGLLATWPNRFTKIEAETLGRTPLKPADQPAIANKVYNGRMGNRNGSDDGWIFRGGGYIQLTGRDNYKLYGIELAPSSIILPEVSARVAVDYWNQNQLSVLFQERGFDAVSNKINTGSPDKPAHGADARKFRYGKVLQAIDAVRKK